MRIGLLFSALLLFASPLWAQTGAISGTVSDAETGEMLPGANAIVEGTGIGVATDTDGMYHIAGLTPGDYTLLVTYTGYQNAEVGVTVQADETTQTDVALNAGVELDPLQVTAGRQQEKVLEAPASITVVTARDIELEAPQTAVKALRNVTGLDIVQTGIDRHEVVLRGFGNVFSGATHVLTDYRQAGAPVLNINVHSIMPSLPIDIERVEVVRGPGAALYGPGVSSGVIHYISKDAFSYPGMTVSVGGGEQSMLNFQGRVAGVVGQKLGLKMSGTYARANEFSLQSCDAALLEEQRFSDCPDPLDAQQLYIDGPREELFKKLSLAGSADYRFNDYTSLVIGGGIGTLHGAILSGIGTVQSVGYSSSYGQARFNSGPFFAQAYLNVNDSGDTYVYNGDPVVEHSTQANVQAQYDLQLGLRQSLIMGVDLEFLSPNSRGTVYGRNEESDNLQEYGAYVQYKTQLTSKFDLVAALRGDYQSIFGKVWLSPRAALVFKPSTTSSVRLTYNRTVVNPSATALFLDLVAAKLPISANAALNVRGRGAANGFTWNRNADYLAIGAPTDLVASSMIPGMVGMDAPVGLPTGLVYGLMYQGMAAIPNDDLADMLIDALGLDPALHAVLASQMETIKTLLHPDETQVAGFSAGQLGLLNLSSQSIDPIANDLTPQPALKPQTARSIEVGYKGILNDRVLLSADVYFAYKKNFTGALQMKTPFVLVPTLSQDLTRDLAAGIENNADLLALLDILATLSGLDLTPEAAASILVGIAGSALPSASTPVGVVQPNENHAGEGNLPELLVTYPNFGQINYYGADLALQVLASDALSLFGNMSWVSDDFFDHTETGEENESAVLALNAPAMKFKLGGTMRFNNGLSLTVSGRYIDGFRMISGQYIGDVESYFLVDLGIGYRLGRALRADLNVANVTNNLHREFIGAPKVGRVGALRLLYDMSW